MLKAVKDISIYSEIKLHIDMFGNDEKLDFLKGGGDAWRISGEDRSKHDAQFFSLKPVNGFVTGK